MTDKNEFPDVSATAETGTDSFFTQPCIRRTNIGKPTPPITKGKSASNPNCFISTAAGASNTHTPDCSSR